jgi:NifU-like protein
MYSQIVWDHFQSPQNKGALPDATASGKAHYAKCGDHFELLLKLDGTQIVAAKFEAHACAPVVAMGSIGTELLTGLTITEARQLDAFRLDQALGCLPAPKRHAILLFLQSLHQALNSIEIEVQ